MNKCLYINLKKKIIIRKITKYSLEIVKLRILIYRIKNWVNAAVFRANNLK